MTTLNAAEIGVAKSYYVSYCVQTGEANANPLWHALLVFAEKDDTNQTIEVQTAHGFYSDPKGPPSTPIVGSIKNLLGVKFNLQDGHGYLQKENLRCLDIGGLYGTSFRLEKIKYDEIIENLSQKMVRQQEAIDALNAELENSNCVTRLQHETENPPPQGPRLRRFDIKVKLSPLGGLDSSPSYTCKQYALDTLLEHDVITPEQKVCFEGHSYKKAFPRYTGTSIFPWASEIKLLPMRFISVSQQEQGFDYHVDPQTQKVRKNRDWCNTRLYMTQDVIEMSHQLNQQDYTQYLKQNRLIATHLKLASSLVNQLYAKEVSVEQANALMYTQQRKALEEAFTALHRLNFTNDDILNLKTQIEMSKALLNPPQINSTFLWRLLESQALKNTAASLIIVGLATQYLNPVGLATALVMLSLFISKQGYNFYKNEQEFKTRCQAYDSYQKDTRPEDLVNLQPELGLDLATR